MWNQRSKNNLDIIHKQRKMETQVRPPRSNFAKKEPTTADNSLAFTDFEFSLTSAAERDWGYVIGSLLLQISQGSNIGRNLFFLSLFGAMLGTLPRAIAAEHVEDDRIHTTESSFTGENQYTHFGSKKSLKESKTFRQYLDQRTLVDPYVSESARKDVAQNCEKLKDRVASTIEKLPHAKNHIIPTVQKAGFRIVCTNQERVQGEGQFHPESKGIFMSVDIINKIDESLINHEFIHAHNFFLHETKQCMTDDLEDKVAPVYPVSEKNIKEYHEAFDAGDRRIKEFEKLWKKKLKQEPLTKEEKTRLNKYITASKGCLLNTSTINMSRDQYESWMKAGWKDNEINSRIIGTEFGEQELIKVFKVAAGGDSYQYQAVIKPLQGAQTVLLTPRGVQTTLESALYRNRSAAVKLAERETYTFQSLSEKAIKTFYPEAYQLRTAYIEKCADETLDQRAIPTTF